MIFEDILKIFELWFTQAQKEYSIKQLDNFNAFVLSTSTDKPFSRMVLLKSFSEKGFTFFTNYNSDKSQQISKNPNVSMLFYWPLLNKQVRISGVAKKISSQESNKYFQSRVRKSQLGAWASKQSSSLDNYDTFLQEVDMYDNKFPHTVPHPKHWGGFIIKPNYFEFWLERDYRLHERHIYKKNKEHQWESSLLYP